MRWWQLPLFIFVVLVASYAIFPTKKDMLQYYLESGDLPTALRLIAELTGKAEVTYKQQMTESRVFLQMGKTAQAIDALKKSSVLRPEDPEPLTRLAQALEWAMRPREALPVYERLAELEPENYEVRNKLITGYRYFAMHEQESLTIAKSVPLRRKLSAKNKEDAFQILVWSELEVLSRKRLAGPNPIRDSLMQRLYVMAEQYEAAKLTGGLVNIKEYFEYGLGLFVEADELQKAKTMALKLDKAYNFGMLARLALARVLTWNGQIADAVAYLEELERSDPRNEQIYQAMIEAGRAGKGFDYAIERGYAKLATLFPERRAYQKELADVYFQRKKFRETLDVLRELLPTEKDRVASLKLICNVALASGDKQLLAESAALVEGSNPEDEGLIRTLADVYLAMEQPRRAYPVLKAMLEKQGADRASVRQLLETAFYTGDSDIIVEAQQIALRQYPDDIGILRSSVEAFLAAQRNVEAFAALKALALRTKDPGDVCRMLEIAGWADNPVIERDAAQTAERIIRERPSLGPTLKPLLAASYYRSGDAKRAAAYYGAASDASPSDTDAAIAAADVYAAADNPVVAVRYLERAYKHDPSDMVLLKKLALFYGYAGMYDKLIAAYEKLDALKLLGPQGRVDLARAYVDKKRWADALRYLEPLAKALKLGKEEGVLLAVALSQSGRAKEAGAVYRRLGGEYPTDAKYLSYLGAEAVFISDLNTGLWLFDKALRQDPINAVALKGKAMIEAANNDPEKAIRSYRRYNRKYGNDPEGRFFLAELYTITGREEDAAGAYQKAMRLLRKQEKDKRAAAARDKEAR
jgi:tetratricopeptide (TPR) repeat protein